MSVAIQAAADLFYFGRPDRRLFGALHESQSYAQREHGIVLCYPFGQEYIRAHRACRHLALRLAQEGFPVLRFDYGGTGDSAGEAEDARLCDWRDDIGFAIDTLRDRTGVEYISLAGLRLGASLALEVAVGRLDVTSTILWEPIVEGDRYLTELSDQHQELLWRFFDEANRLSISSSNEYLGFPVGPDLRGEFQRLDLLALPPVHDHQTLIVESTSSPEIGRLREFLHATGTSVAYEQIPSFPAWRDDVDKGLVPEQIVKAVTTWAAEVLS